MALLRLNLVLSLKTLGGLFITNVAPKVVIYDNACNLHDYALNRDPGFFKNTKFFVDRFHWFNHKGKSSVKFIAFFNLNYGNTLF